MISNCYLWARAHYRQRHREWIKAGAPKGLEPYFMERKTRLRVRGWFGRWITRQVPHYLVGWRDMRSGVLQTVSFVPRDRRYELRWWQLARVLLFRGTVMFGDSYKTTGPARG